VDEFIEKSKVLPSDIQWHFIGHLQSNKAKKLVKVPNLHVLETLDSEKLATLLDKECGKLSRTLNVMIQVLTSETGEKQGIEPENVLNLA
jgi:PLP dependent protein